jgi:hypothetical protein
MAKDVKYRERKVVVKFGVGPPRLIRKQQEVTPSFTRIWISNYFLIISLSHLR